MTPSRLKTLAKLAISAGLIVFLLTGLDRADLLDRLAGINPLWLGIALLLYILAILLGVAKWRVLVKVQGLEASFGDLARYTFAGLFVANILPSNLGGDLVRAFELARANRGPAEPAVMSVVMDRLLGLVAFCAAALVSAILALIWLKPSPELEGLLVASAVAFFFAAALGAAALFSSRVAADLRSLLDRGWMARLVPSLAGLFHAVQVYRHSLGAITTNIFLSASILVTATLAWYGTARALGLDISLLYFFLFNPLVGLVLLLPISFNGLGPKEATAVFFFGLIGVPRETALALSLLFHAIIVLTSSPGGMLLFRSRRLPSNMSPDIYRLQEPQTRPDV